MIFFFFRFPFSAIIPFLFHHLPFPTITSHQYEILLYIMALYFPYLISCFPSPCGSSCALYHEVNTIASTVDSSGNVVHLHGVRTNIFFNIIWYY